MEAGVPADAEWRAVDMLNAMVWLWLAVVALALILEASTMSLVSVWFAMGALVTVFAAYGGMPVTGQLLIFVSVSIATFFAARPLTRRFLDPHITPTNADRLLGQDAKVTEEINNTISSGAVYVDGKIWTARSASGEVIPKDEMVEVVWMEGVKLYVQAKAAVPA